MKYNEYINKIGFTEDELKILSDTDEKCRSEFSEELSLARIKYDEGDAAFGLYLSELSEKSEIPVNTLNLYIYLHLMEDTYKEYQKRGIADSVFLDTLLSFVIVSRLPFHSGQPFGVMQAVYRSWLRRNLDCIIYRLGNLEFELVSAPRDMEIEDVSLKKGETCISVHIPRGVSFKEELCEAAFAQAREFFKKHYNMENVIFMCGSWLLYPWLCEVLPETSSIAKFQKMFKILGVNEDDSGISWIFGNGIGCCECTSTEDLSEDTSLRRAAKRRLLDGKKLGSGLGIRL